MPPASSQRKIIAAKIAAANALAAAQDMALIDAQRQFCAAFSGFFPMPTSDLRLTSRPLSHDQLLAASSAMECWWVLADPDPVLAIGLSDRLVVAAADVKILGAFSTATEAAPTAIDRSVATAFARRLAGQFAPFSEEADPVAALKPSTKNLASALPATGRASWRVLSFEGAFPEGGGSFAAVIARPEAKLEVVAGGEEGAARAQSPDSALLQRLRGLKVTAHCHAGRVDAPLAQVLALKSGDVVAIDWLGAAGAQLVVGGQELAVGMLGEHQGRRAIRIGGPEEVPDKGKQRSL